jgi:hypothetical protein
VIQIDQRIPRCARCGRTIHPRARRLEARGAGRRPILICSELCREEYEALHPELALEWQQVDEVASVAP